MRTSILSIAAVSLFQLASAQPHRAGKRHAHQEQHEKRDVFTVTNVVYEPPTGEVVVIVDQFGNPVSTMTESITVTSSSTYVAVSTSSAAPVVQEAVTSTSAAPTISAYTPAYTPPSSSTEAPSSTYTPASRSASSSSAAASSSASSSSGKSGYGITYSPYNADGSCKTSSQVAQDFESFGADYGTVRTYGTDCDQVATVLSAAKTYGMTLMAGIYDLSTLSSEISTIVSAANGDWSSFHTIVIGNEIVNSGTASASTVVAAISTARGLLTAAGYSGYVVTVDTLVAMRSNPSLCDASDYCAANSHPFFDGNTVAENSGSFLTTQIPTLAAVLSDPNQKIVITETGWPWKGETNGVAVPSPENQASAISSIKASFSDNQEGVMLFTAYNDYWKTNDASQFEAEQYWGFLGDAPSG